MKQNGETFARPTTPDIIEIWMSKNPKVGHIVAVSHDPYALFQNDSMKAPLIKSGCFQRGGALESVGAANAEKSNMSVQLDNVARYMYCILQQQEAEVAASKK